MLRQHQFEKVEMVTFSLPDKSNDEHVRMTNCAESILKELKLPFRKVELCSGDLGFSAKKLLIWKCGCQDKESIEKYLQYQTGDFNQEE